MNCTTELASRGDSKTDYKFDDVLILENAACETRGVFYAAAAVGIGIIFFSYSSSAGTFTMAFLE